MSLKWTFNFRDFLLAIRRPLIILCAIGQLLVFGLGCFLLRNYTSTRSFFNGVAGNSDLLNLLLVSLIW